MMKSIFRVVFYLRSNYVNKEGKTSVMLRIYLNNERLSLGSTGISVKSSQWDKEKERIKGRTTEALNTNLQLDNIASGLQSIFRRIEMSDVVSLERIKSEFLGKKEEIDTLMQLFENTMAMLQSRLVCLWAKLHCRNTTYASVTFRSFLKNNTNAVISN